MEIKTARFQCSSEFVEQCPTDQQFKEFAFIGRSNVGKSSLINMLTRHSGLAKVSGTPGKTQLINHFVINENWWLVDLPGYGYAKTSKKMRAAFGAMIRRYILEREQLYCLFVLVDSRHKPQEIDLKFMSFLGENSIPFCIIFTKADKLSASQMKGAKAAYERELLEYWEELPPMFVTSAEKARGAEELLSYIGSCLEIEDIQEQTIDTEDSQEQEVEETQE